MKRARIAQIALLAVMLLSVCLSAFSIWRHGGDSPAAGARFQADGSRISQQRAFQGGGGFGQQRSGGGRTDGRSLGQDGGAGQSGTAFAGGSGKDTVPTVDGPRSGGGNVRFGRFQGSSVPYAVPLAVYSVLFFGAAVGVYFGVTRKNLRLPERGRPLLVSTLLVAGLCLRIAIAPWVPGHPFDINLFKQWAVSAANDLSGFYMHGSSDYPPLYIYIFYAIGKLSATSAFGPYLTILIKLPSILADAATAYLLYRAAVKNLSFEAGLLIAAFYMLNPAVLINSTFWGQVDSFFTLIIVASIVLLSENKLARGAALLTAGVLTKPQAIVYLPVLFFALVATKRMKPWLQATAAALGTALVVVLPFSVGQDPLWLFKLYAGTVNEYPYASVNAFNFFALLGANYKQDSSTLLLFSYHTWGMILIAAVTLLSWRLYARSRNSKFAAAASLLQIAGVFTFSSSMHERYLFPAAALALLAYVYFRDKRLLWFAAGFSLTIFANTYYILYHTTGGGAPYNVTMMLTSALNVVLVAFLAKVLWDRAKRGSRRLEKIMLATGSKRKNSGNPETRH